MATKRNAKPKRAPRDPSGRTWSVDDLRMSAAAERSWDKAMERYAGMTRAQIFGVEEP